VVYPNNDAFNSRITFFPPCRKSINGFNVLNDCTWYVRGFINVFSRSGQLVFTGRQNLLELNFFIGKLSARWSNQAGKIILTGSQFAWCQALNESLVSTNLLEGIKRFYFA